MPKQIKTHKLVNHKFSAGLSILLSEAYSAGRHAVEDRDHELASMIGQFIFDVVDRTRRNFAGVSIEAVNLNTPHRCPSRTSKFYPFPNNLAMLELYAEKNFISNKQ